MKYMMIWKKWWIGSKNLMINNLDVDLKRKILRTSAEMEMNELCEGKSDDWINGFNVGMRFVADYAKEQLDLIFNDK